MVARLALALLLASTTGAAAEGERSPMLGGNLVAVDGADERAGVGLDMTWWAWRVGIAAEASTLWADSASRVTVVGASLRLLAYDALIESFLEPRHVELGIELHGVAERWFSDLDQTRYGVGVALRLRGGADYDLSSLLAESRVFVRVMTTQTNERPVAARMIGPSEREPMMVIVGLGVAWGSGHRDYLDRFRMEPFSPAARRLADGWLE